MILIKHDFGFDRFETLRTAGWIMLRIAYWISVFVVGVLSLTFLIWVV